MEYGESIYNINLPKSVVPEKGPLWKSVHNPLCPPTCSTFGLKGTSLPGVKNVQGDLFEPECGFHVFSKNGATLGPPLSSIKPDPSRPLVKKSKATCVETLAELKKNHSSWLTTTRSKSKLKPAIPKSNDIPFMGIKSDKNFILSNAVNAILSMAPKVKEPENYLKKSDYGRVPQYLEEVKKEIETEYKCIERIREGERKLKSNTSGYMLPDEERIQLLNKLNKKREILNHKYQGMTYITNIDTLGQIRRKEYFENQLEEIEIQINKLSKPTVYIVCQ